MLRDTSAQDRVIEPKNLFRRHRNIFIAASAAVLGLIILGVFLMRYSGAGTSVDRARVSIATVEHGSFVRDIAADGQVVAAVSPTLYANALGTVTLKVHAGDAVTKGQVLAVVDSPDLTAKLSQEEATLVSLRVDWQRATLDADTKAGAAARRLQSGAGRSKDRATRTRPQPQGLSSSVPIRNCRRSRRRTRWRRRSSPSRRRRATSIRSPSRIDSTSTARRRCSTASNTWWTTSSARSMA